VTHPGNDLDFDPAAPNDTAACLYRMAAANRASVLHLGVGAGAVVRALSALDDLKVTRVVAERSTLEAEPMDGTENFVADPDAAGWHNALDGRTYDIVIAADLLERLRDPARALRDLREQRLLAEDGRLLVSFANIAHPAVMNELLSADSARIRWYTISSMNRLLAASGYVVVETHEMHRPASGQPAARDNNEAQPFEYVLQARPAAAAPQLALLQQQLDDVTQRLAAAETRRDQSNALLEEERTAFQEEIARGAAELEQLQNQLSQRTDERSALREETARLHRQIARLQDELAAANQGRQRAMERVAAIQQSRSYRWSRAVARVAHGILALLGSVRRRRPEGTE
jgi:hypothetical protein